MQKLLEISKCSGNGTERRFHRILYFPPLLTDSSAMFGAHILQIFKKTIIKKNGCMLRIFTLFLILKNKIRVVVILLVIFIAIYKMLLCKQQ